MIHTNKDKDTRDGLLSPAATNRARGYGWYVVDTQCRRIGKAFDRHADAKSHCISIGAYGVEFMAGLRDGDYLTNYSK